MNTLHLTDDVLYGFDDDTLAADVRRATAAHLRDCAVCRERLARAHAVKHALHTQLSQARAPQPLRTSIRQRIAVQAAPAASAPARSSLRAAALGAGAAVVLAGLFVLALWLTQPPSLLGQLAQAHAGLAQDATPLEVRGDASAVGAWFDGKLPRPLEVPTIASMSLVGGRLDQIEGEPAAHLVYQGADGAAMSLLVWRGTAPPTGFVSRFYEGGLYYVGTQGAETVVIWPVGDMRYACVSVAPADVVVDMAGKVRRGVGD